MVCGTGSTQVPNLWALGGYSPTNPSFALLSPTGETSTGQFGVYTMGPGANGSGIAIRRHDLTKFRQQQPAAPVAGPGGAVPALPNQPVIPNP